MRIRILAAISLGLLAAACQTSRPHYQSAAPDYPGSYMDSRGNRVDAGSRGTPAQQSQPDPGQSQPDPGLGKTPRVGGRGPVAWTDKGYSYDVWGNLISTPR